MSAEHLEPPSGIQETWIFCLDDESRKMQLMNGIISLKLKKQHQLGVYIYKDKKPAPNPKKITEEDSMNELFPPVTKKDTSGDRTNGNDGYWIILQDWTDCTLKCGGGLSYQQ